MEDVINMNVALTSWIIFWMTYWTFGFGISWLAHRNGVRQITQLQNVIPVLLINMFWSLVGMTAITYIPFRGLLNAHNLVKVLINYIITDILFYHIHLLMHQPQIYPYVHKMHHSFSKDVYALTALYCTGYEMIFLNVLSTSLGCVLMQMPPLYIYIWFFLVSLNAVSTHSGFTLSFLIDGNHIIHHELFNYNYGTSVYLDKLYGTFYQKRNEIDTKEEMHLGNFHLNELDIKLD